eukprot:CAMPEP_0183713324 /NCGR_PEP_ID=MMETSP0737-20130205/8198_1 /TAXON_ID=385413 /ORGANISM="Thalassiosira miniscula, Strain CCMP1093" /LENGTH=300 /DNA_ID=CAMNT_0025942091 /DNA_START=29 /DNA_END=931 /DNA_ORIENTATION=-
MANDPIKIQHTKTGASCTIYPFGAHLTSYQTGSGKELLFLSRDAKLDGSKAIRGGIPLCFPQFGQPYKSMPQHGFLRNNYWKEVAESRVDDDDGAGISMELALKDVVNARGGKWDTDTKLDAKCTYTVKINGDGFTTTITMDNLGTESWDFQVLLHNYFLVQSRAALDGSQCNVKGLEGYAVSDKVSGEEYTLGADPVTIPEIIIDRVYTPPKEKMDLSVTIAAGPSNNISLTASGEVDGTNVPVSGVVWNPHEEKANGMGDFGDDQYVDMICVEPGLLSDVPSLEGGKKASFTQVITCL